MILGDRSQFSHFGNKVISYLRMALPLLLLGLNLAGCSFTASLICEKSSSTQVCLYAQKIANPSFNATLSRSNLWTGDIAAVAIEGQLSSSSVLPSPGYLDAQNYLHIPLNASSASGTLHLIPTSGSATDLNFTIKKFTDFAQYQATGSAVDAVAYNIVEGPNGYLYAVGKNRSASSRWVVRRSTDSGVSWSTIDEWSGVNSGNAVALDIAVDSSSIYVVGYDEKDWVVRKSSVASISWQVVDRYRATSTEQSKPNSILIHSSGAILVAGQAIATGDFANSWVVRRSSNGGSTWTSVDFWQAEFNLDTIANRIRENPSNNEIWVVGNSSDSTNGVLWRVRKSSNAGLSFLDAYQYQYQAGSNGNIGSDIGFYGANTIYLSGQAYYGSLDNRAFILKSTDGGASFSTVDIFIPAAFRWAGANSILVNNDGSVLWTGRGDVAALYANRWFIRRSVNGNNGTFSTVSSYSLGGSSLSQGYSIIKTSAAHYYSAGYATDTSNSISNWQILKSTDATTWVSNNQYQGLKNNPGIANAILELTNGDLISAGSAQMDGATYQWVINRSTDSGLNWTTTDQVEYQSGYKQGSVHSLVQVGGSLLAAGLASDSTGSIWLVRRSTDNGQTWSNVLSRAINSEQYSRVGIWNLPGTNIILTSTVVNDDWIIYRSMDSGATWSSAQIFTPYPGAGASLLNNKVVGMALSSSRICLGSSLLNLLGGNSFLIRCSTDAGLTWNTQLTYDGMNSAPLYPANMVKDVEGNLIVPVSDNPASNNSVDGLRLLKSIDNGVSWTSSDFWGNGVDSIAASDSLVDQDGRLIIVGSINYQSGSQAALVLTSLDKGNSFNINDSLLRLNLANQNEWRNIYRLQSGALCISGQTDDSDQISTWTLKKLQ